MFSYSGPRHVKVTGLWDEQALTGEEGEEYLDVLKGVQGLRRHVPGRASASWAWEEACEVARRGRPQSLAAV